MTDRRYTSLNVIRRLLSEAGDYRKHVVAIFVLNLIGTPIAILRPIPLKIVVDNVIGSDPVPAYISKFIPGSPPFSSTYLLIAAVGLMIGLALFAQVRAFGTSYLRAYTAENMIVSFRARLFDHAQRLSLAYHDRAGSTDSTYRILYDATSITQVLLGSLIPIIRAWFPLIGMIIVMALLDFQLTLVALGVAPVLAVLIHVFGNRMKEKWASVKELDSSAMSVIQESLSTLRVVKAFRKEKAEKKRFVKESNRRIRKHMDATLTSSTYSFLVNMTIAIATAAVLLLGTLHVQSGILTIGELLMVMAYIRQIFSPLNTLSQSAAGLTNGLASAERALQLLDEAPEVVDRPDALKVERVKGRVEFENVSFSYVDNSPVLKGVSFKVEPGARVAIRGKTGAGKSTLMSLLMRFYEPDSGTITVDGRDIRDLRIADYRNQFAIVLQDPVLFSSSIAENIAYGKPGATTEDIVRAATLANAHGFISELEDGYDTEVGERGALLSGGERQRVSCARAFLKDAPILILDEPTSSVDVGTESLIIEAFERLLEGRTAFVISHRETTLAGCTQILHVKDGGVESLAVSGQSLGVAAST